MAYNVATLTQKDEPLPDGRVRIMIRFSGNAGEITRDLEHYVDGSETLQTLRRWSTDQAARMGAGKTIVDSLTIGQSINLTPIAPPTPTAEEVWRSKVARLLNMQAVGLTNATAVADLSALRTDVNNTYLTVYL